MRTVIERLLLMVGCSYVFLQREQGILVIYTILGILVANELILIAERRLITGIVCGAFLGGCFIDPSLLCFVPMFLYALCYHKMKAMLVCFFLLVIPGAHLPISVSCPIIFFSGVGIWMALRLTEDERLSKKVIELKDSSKENEILLKEKNKELRINQDNAVHLAMLQERNRIAREIHDNVGHLLSRSILLTGALLAINTQEDMKEGLLGLKDALGIAMDEIRSSVHDLHEESIDLQACIRQILNKFTFCQVNLDYEIETDLNREIKNCFLTIIKEALNNVIRHSNATEVKIIVREHPSLCQLEIEDNGTKKVSEEYLSGCEGLGLNSMRERVDSLNGQMVIHSNEGFKIFISVPKKGGM